MLPKAFLPLVVAAVTSSTIVRAAESFEPARLEKEILVPGCRDALQLECLPDGRILFVEFWGSVKVWDPSTKRVTTLGTIPTHAAGEVGLLGFAAAKDFVQTGHLYALFCPSEKTGTMRVSRFTVRDQRMDPASESILLSWDYDTEHVFHMGGAMWMDAKGDLYVGNGDNCHYNPGLPVDPRPGRKSWDAQRSAANSRDLRGKILRIHPTPDGKYTIPEGNLFADGKEGAPEVYCMGIRNPYRITVDDQTSMLYIGDVGPNVVPELGVTPLGYEEINATKTAANFGWPYFVGPNEALPLFDFDAKKEIKRQSPDAPRNDSPNNTGTKQLPSAKPALIWYSSVASAEFPSVGSGGRSVMAGPVYHFDARHPSAIRLPERFDGKLFVYEWMRNWIQVADVSKPRPTLEPIIGGANLRRPIDLKIGPDGALYMIEYGDQWWNNTDSQISRLVYRRGNRAPVARVDLTENAGLAPFMLKATAARSSDPDSDQLRFEWTVDGKKIDNATAVLERSVSENGQHEVVVTVTDPHGASHQSRAHFHVGNARPIVRVAAPAHGSFFDWGQEIPYSMQVTESDGDAVREADATVEGEFRARRFAPDGIEAVDPGLAQIRTSTCLSCHSERTASAGPAYREVALRYKGDKTAADRLTEKILNGGGGVWGQLPMPPHPQHTAAQVRLMVDWILSLSAPQSLPVAKGSRGKFHAPAKPDKSDRAGEGVLILSAAYTDDGKGGTLPRLRGEQTIVLHSRKKKAALCDANHGMAAVEQVEGETGLIGRFEDGAHILFKDIRLDGIEKLTVRGGSFKRTPATLEIRKGGPTGDLLATVTLPQIGEGPFENVQAEIQSAGLVDICVIARCTKKGEVGLNWIEFHSNSIHSTKSPGS
jgi:cytochrome c